MDRNIRRFMVFFVIANFQLSFSGCINPHMPCEKFNATSPVIIIPSPAIPSVTIVHKWTEINYTAKGTAKGFVAGAADTIIECFSGADHPAVSSLCLLLMPIYASVGGVIGSFETEDFYKQSGIPPQTLDSINKFNFNQQLAETLVKDLNRSENLSFVLDDSNECDDLNKNKIINSLIIDAYSYSFIGNDDLLDDFRLKIDANVKLYSKKEDEIWISLKKIFSCTTTSQTFLEWQKNNYQNLHSNFKICIDDISSQIREHFLKYNDFCDPYTGSTLVNLSPNDQSPERESYLGQIKVKYKTTLLCTPGWRGFELRAIDPSSTFEAIKETDNWVYVKTIDGEEGWIAKEWIQD